MTDFVWQYAYNLGQNYEIVFACGLLLCLAILIHASGVRGKRKFGDVEYSDAIWRQHAAVQGAGILALVWVLLGSVPAPDFQKQIVYKDRIREVPKVVVKKVPVAVKVKVGRGLAYKEVYDTCIAAFNTGNHYATKTEAAKCHEYATEATDTRPVRIIVKHDPYQDLINECGKWNMGEDEKVSDRRKLCHEQAMEGSRQYILLQKKKMEALNANK